QAVLLIVLPLVWALVYRSLETRRLGQTLVGLVAASAVLANTHLLFPLSAAPCVLLLTRPPVDRKRILLVPAAILIGWFLSPFDRSWFGGSWWCRSAASRWNSFRHPRSHPFSLHSARSSTRFLD